METFDETKKRVTAAFMRIMWRYFALSFAFFFVPESLASAIPLMDMVVRLPGIARISAVCPFPNAMGLALAVTWLGFPVAIALFAKASGVNPRFLRMRKFDQWFLIGAGALIGMLFPVFIFYFPGTQESILDAGGRGGMVVRAMTQNRLTAGSIIGFVFCMSAGCLGIAWHLARAAVMGGADPAAELPKQ